MLIDVDKLLTMASILPPEKQTYHGLIRLINEVACAEAVDDLYSLYGIIDEKTNEVEKRIKNIYSKNGTYLYIDEYLMREYQLDIMDKEKGIKKFN